MFKQNTELSKKKKTGSSAVSPEAKNLKGSVAILGREKKRTRTRGKVQKHETQSSLSKHHSAGETIQPWCSGAAALNTLVDGDELKLCLSPVKTGAPGSLVDKSKDSRTTKTTPEHART